MYSWGKIKNLQDLANNQFSGLKKFQEQVLTNWSNLNTDVVYCLFQCWP